MRNTREIILDFTSLLDVIMLILFFFVIFSQFDTNAAIERAEAMQAEAQQQAENALEEWSAANEALKEAEAQLEELQQANALAESIIINGTDDFSKALRLKMVLTGEKSDWSISVQRSEEKDGEIVYVEIGRISDVRNRKIEDMTGELEQIIIDLDFSKDDAFLCDLMYDSSKAGSRIAKINTDTILKELQQNLGYKFIFVSTTDLSGMGF